MRPRANPMAASARSGTCWTRSTTACTSGRGSSSRMTSSARWWTPTRCLRNLRGSCSPRAPWAQASRGPSTGWRSAASSRSRTSCSSTRTSSRPHSRNGRATWRTTPRPRGPSRATSRATSWRSPRRWLYGSGSTFGWTGRSGTATGTRSTSSGSGPATRSMRSPSCTSPRTSSSSSSARTNAAGRRAASCPRRRSVTRSAGSRRRWIASRPSPTLSPRSTTAAPRPPWCATWTATGARSAPRTSGRRSSAGSSRCGRAPTHGRSACSASSWGPSLSTAGARGGQPHSARRSRTWPCVTAIPSEPRRRWRRRSIIELKSEATCGQTAYRGRACQCHAGPAGAPQEAPGSVTVSLERPVGKPAASVYQTDES
mmetsp:Transcript_8902/g.30265  ORF Transcript_8902/g.30265 Transcript_8902/m.30265 type:complete len:371 (+) Transcript_8902:251-1363(+)